MSHGYRLSHLKKKKKKNGKEASLLPNDLLHKLTAPAVVLNLLTVNPFQGLRVWTQLAMYSRPHVWCYKAHHHSDLANMYLSASTGFSGKHRSFNTVLTSSNTSALSDILSRKGMPSLLTSLSSQPFSHSSKGNYSHNSGIPQAEA